jgi:hypothetical protein
MDCDLCGRKVSFLKLLSKTTLSDGLVFCRKCERTWRELRPAIAHELAFGEEEAPEGGRLGPALGVSQGADGVYYKRLGDMVFGPCSIALVGVQSIDTRTIQTDSLLGSAGALAWPLARLGAGKRAQRRYEEMRAQGELPSLATCLRNAPEIEIRPASALSSYFKESDSFPAPFESDGAPPEHEWSAIVIPVSHVEGAVLSEGELTLSLRDQSEPSVFNFVPSETSSTTAAEGLARLSVAAWPAV